MTALVDSKTILLYVDVVKIFPLFLLIPLFTFMPACENGGAAKPTEHERQLARTYVSLVVLNESFPPTTDADSTRLYRHRADSILSANGFTQAEFQEEFQSLVESPDRFQLLMQEMVTTIQRRGSQR